MASGGLAHAMIRVRYTVYYRTVKAVKYQCVQCSYEYHMLY